MLVSTTHLFTDSGSSFDVGTKFPASWHPAFYTDSQINSPYGKRFGKPLNAKLETASLATRLLGG